MGEENAREPCNECLVKACCQDTCTEFAEWFITNKIYIELELGRTVTNHIESLTHEKAIAFVKKCENMARYLDNQ